MRQADKMRAKQLILSEYYKTKDKVIIDTIITYLDEQRSSWNELSNLEKHVMRPIKGGYTMTDQDKVYSRYSAILNEIDLKMEKLKFWQLIALNQLAQDVENVLADQRRSADRRRD